MKEIKQKTFYREKEKWLLRSNLLVETIHFSNRSGEHVTSNLYQLTLCRDLGEFFIPERKIVAEPAAKTRPLPFAAEIEFNRGNNCPRRSRFRVLSESPREDRKLRESGRWCGGRQMDSGDRSDFPAIPAADDAVRVTLRRRKRKKINISGMCGVWIIYQRQKGSRGLSFSLANAMLMETPSIMRPPGYRAPGTIHQKLNLYKF